MQSIESFDFSAALLELLKQQFSATDPAGRPIYTIVEACAEEDFNTSVTVYELNSSSLTALQFSLNDNYLSDKAQPPLLLVKRFHVFLNAGDVIISKQIYCGPFPVVNVPELGIQTDPRFSFVLSHITNFR
jgi:hypothetical protein